MGARLRWIASRIADFGQGFVETFLRDNRVLPPVLAVLALFVIAWILAGVFMGSPEQKPVAHKADLAQSGSNPGPEPVAPGVENRDVDSYAAYRSKDPFRELLAPEQTSIETTTEQTTPEDTTQRRPGRDGTSRGNTATDSDGDGIPNRRERNTGTDPNDPNDPSSGGRSNGRAGDTSGGDAAGGTAGNQNGSGGRAGNRNGGGLLDSGGILPIPGSP